MLTHEKLDFYVRYKGNWENWLRSPEGIRILQSPKPRLRGSELPDELPTEDWNFIDDCLHNYYLTGIGLIEKSYSEKLEAVLLTEVEDLKIVQRLKELVPYKYGLWDKKNSLELFFDWVFRLFS